MRYLEGLEGLLRNISGVSICIIPVKWWKPKGSNVDEFNDSKGRGGILGCLLCGKINPSIPGIITIKNLVLGTIRMIVVTFLSPKFLTSAYRLEGVTLYHYRTLNSRSSKLHYRVLGLK